MVSISDIAAAECFTGEREKAGGNPGLSAKLLPLRAGIIARAAAGLAVQIFLLNVVGVLLGGQLTRRTLAKIPDFEAFRIVPGLGIIGIGSRRGDVVGRRFGKLMRGNDGVAVEAVTAVRHDAVVDIVGMRTAFRR